MTDVLESRRLHAKESRAVPGPDPRSMRYQQKDDVVSSELCDLPQVLRNDG